MSRISANIRTIAPLVALFSTAAPAAFASDTVAYQWTDVMLDVIRNTSPLPPVSARYWAIMDTCMYDAWTAYDARAVPTRENGIPRQGDKSLANMEKAVSYAAYRAVLDLIPSAAAAATRKMEALGYNPNDTTTDVNTPAGVGNVACKAVLDFRHHDGSNQLGDIPGGNAGVPYSDYTGYQPVNTPGEIRDPNRWQPLAVPDGAGGFVVQKYGNPYWGKVVKFNTRLPDFTAPKKPDLYPAFSYDAGVEQILKYSANLTDEQKVIAEYWANGPKSELPPGHWQIFAQWVSRRDRNDLGADVRMFFTLGNALLDASIAAWSAKTQYDYARPVTAVHFLKKDKKVFAWAGPGLGSQWINGQDWRPYQPVTFVTPPFPEFFSGHSIFSAAGAEVLRRGTGSDRFGLCVSQEPGTSAVESGTPSRRVVLCWKTFKDAADEAGLSRRYGGIHFIPGDLSGRDVGKRIGALDYDYAKQLFNGVRTPPTSLSASAN
jgi:hypothetical protein